MFSPPGFYLITSDFKINVFHLRNPVTKPMYQVAAHSLKSIAVGIVAWIVLACSPESLD